MKKILTIILVCSPIVSMADAHVRGYLLSNGNYVDPRERIFINSYELDNYSQNYTILDEIMYDNYIKSIKLEDTSAVVDLSTQTVNKK